MVCSETMKQAAAFAYIRRNLPLYLVVLSFFFMLSNTIRFPVEQMYDASTHLGNIQSNLWVLFPSKLLGYYEYNPPLYYYLFGKVSIPLTSLLRLFSSSVDYVHSFRLLQLIVILVVFILYFLSLIPALIRGEGSIRWFGLSLLVLPNLYLSQVMVTADFLLFLSLNLMFYFWFRFDFSSKLAVSPWRVTVWSVCLIVMANSRHISFPAFAVFFIWGVLKISSHMLRANSMKYAVVMSSLVFLTLIFSGQHYILRYLGGGGVVTFDVNVSGYHRKYAGLTEGFDRVPMFTNTQFGRLIESPNRYARFEGGNSLLPRLYGDMWADHWLYFSGGKMEDNKVFFKRLVLLSASVFTVFYFIIPLVYSINSLVNLLRGNPPDFAAAASLLFVGALISLLLYVYLNPEPGKNSTVKFTHLLGYCWLPLFPVAGFLDRHPKLAGCFSTYTVALYFICVPLYVY